MNWIMPPDRHESADGKDAGCRQAPNDPVDNPLPFQPLKPILQQRVGGWASKLALARYWQCQASAGAILQCCSPDTLMLGHG